MTWDELITTRQALCERREKLIASWRNAQSCGSDTVSMWAAKLQLVNDADAVMIRMACEIQNGAK